MRHLLASPRKRESENRKRSFFSKSPLEASLDRARSKAESEGGYTWTSACPSDEDEDEANVKRTWKDLESEIDRRMAQSALQELEVNSDVASVGSKSRASVSTSVASIKSKASSSVSSWTKRTLVSAFSVLTPTSPLAAEALGSPRSITSVTSKKSVRDRNKEDHLEPILEDVKSFKSVKSIKSLKSLKTIKSAISSKSSKSNRSRNSKKSQGKRKFLWLKKAPTNEGLGAAEEPKSPSSFSIFSRTTYKWKKTSAAKQRLWLEEVRTAIQQAQGNNTETEEEYSLSEDSSDIFTDPESVDSEYDEGYSYATQTTQTTDNRHSYYEPKGIPSHDTDDASVSSLEVLFNWLTCTKVDQLFESDMKKFDPRGMVVKTSFEEEEEEDRWDRARTKTSRSNRRDRSLSSERNLRVIHSV